MLDITDVKIGALKVKLYKPTTRICLCNCDCGKQIEVSIANIRNESILDCGCGISKKMLVPVKPAMKKVQVVEDEEETSEPYTVTESKSVVTYSVMSKTPAYIHPTKVDTVICGLNKYEITTVNGNVFLNGERSSYNKLSTMFDIDYNRLASAVVISNKRLSTAVAEQICKRAKYKVANRAISFKKLCEIHRLSQKYVLERLLNGLSVGDACRARP